MRSFETLRSGDQDDTDRQFDQIVGSSPALEFVLTEVERVARTDSSVVLGETGTGKELIASACLSWYSGRSPSLTIPPSRLAAGRRYERAKRELQLHQERH